MTDDANEGHGHGHNSGDEPQAAAVGGIEGTVLLSFLERIANLDEEIKGLNTDKSDVYKEAEDAGFDKKTLKNQVRRRRMNDVELAAEDETLALYERAAEVAAANRVPGAPAGTRTHDARTREDDGKTSQEESPEGQRQATEAGGAASETGASPAEADEGEVDTIAGMPVTSLLADGTPIVEVDVFDDEDDEGLAFLETR